jgi:hypothetical protein
MIVHIPSEKVHGAVTKLLGSLILDIITLYPFNGGLY